MTPLLDQLTAGIRSAQGGVDSVYGTNVVENSGTLELVAGWDSVTVSIRFNSERMVVFEVDAYLRVFTGTHSCNLGSGAVEHHHTAVGVSRYYTCERGVSQGFVTWYIERVNSRAYSVIACYESTNPSTSAVGH